MQGPHGWLSVGLALLGFSLLITSAKGQENAPMNTYGDWKYGRATYYGGGDGSIHEGSCGYNHISPGEPLGWNIAALSDVHPLYPRGVCGYCLEVKCAPISFLDGYGNRLDRTNACWNTSTSLVVRVTDTCPCTYAPNAYSNKRWCCGDMDHLDLSFIAFGSLAPMKWGVIGLQYRQVPCQYKPKLKATQTPYAYQDPTYNKSAPLPLRYWPEYMTNRPKIEVVFGDSGLASQWQDASWNTDVVPIVPGSAIETAGINKTPALCANISLNGALSLITSNNTMFVNRTRLGFWMYVGVAGYNGLDAKVADITIELSGTQGNCERPRIWYVRPSLFVPTCAYCEDYYWHWEFHLPGFQTGGDLAGVIRPGEFSGCGGNGVMEINRISFRNDGYGGLTNKYMCLDSVYLL